MCLVSLWSARRKGVLPKISFTNYKDHLMTPTIAFDSTVVPLTPDANGYVAHIDIDIDGRPHIIHVTATPTGPRVLSPPKWCATR